MTKRSSKKTQARRSSLKTFVKVVNYTHLMPTRYQMDVDLKAVVTPDALDNSTKKVEARKEVGAVGGGGTPGRFFLGGGAASAGAVCKGRPPLAAVVAAYWLGAAAGLCMCGRACLASRQQAG